MKNTDRLFPPGSEVDGVPRLALLKWAVIFLLAAAVLLYLIERGM